MCAGQKSTWFGDSSSGRLGAFLEALAGAPSTVLERPTTQVCIHAARSATSASKPFAGIQSKPPPPCLVRTQTTSRSHPLHPSPSLVHCFSAPCRSLASPSARVADVCVSTPEGVEGIRLSPARSRRWSASPPAGAKSRLLERWVSERGGDAGWRLGRGGGCLPPAAAGQPSHAPLAPGDARWPVIVAEPLAPGRARRPSLPAPPPLSHRQLPPSMDVLFCPGSEGSLLGFSTPHLHPLPSPPPGTQHGSWAAAAAPKPTAKVGVRASREAAPPPHTHTHAPAASCVRARKVVHPPPFPCLPRHDPRVLPPPPRLPLAAGCFPCPLTCVPRAQDIEVFCTFQDAIHAAILLTPSSGTRASLKQASVGWGRVGWSVRGLGREG